MPSITVSAIREISKRLKPRLAASEWTRKSPHYIRTCAQVIHGIHFQASQFGSADSGTFTINLVVTEPRVYQAWCRRPLPANPATALFPVQKRIGRIDSQPHDRWWTVSVATDISEMEAEIFELLKKAEQTFFPCFLSLESMLDRLRTCGSLPGLHHGQNPAMHGLIAAILGHDLEAKRVLRDLVTSSKVEGFNKNVREAAKNVGIII